MTTSYNACHSGAVPVFVSEFVKMHGGGTSHNLVIGGMDLLLDLTGNISVDRWTLPSRWKAAVAIPEVEIVKMKISDTHAPWEASMDFWQTLWSDLEAEAKDKGRGKENPLNVVVACMGGHGRTGTVLTALAHAAGIVPNPDKDDIDLLDLVRRIYCKKAVETKEQVEYLNSIGVKIIGTPSYTTTTTSYGYQSNHPNTNQAKDTKGGGQNSNGALTKSIANRPCTCQSTNGVHLHYCAKFLSPKDLLNASKDDDKDELDGYGMQGSDGKWYTSEEIVAMTDEKYNTLFSSAS